MFIARRATLVTEATPDYASGDLLGGKLEFDMRTPEGGGTLRRLLLKCIDAISVAATLYLFDSDPDATTFTENDAFSLHADDRDRLIGAVAIASGDWLNASSPTGLYIADKSLAMPFQFGPGEFVIYAALVAGGTINLSSTSSIAAILGAEVD